MSAPTRPAPRRIHIDTDPGLDDLLALAFAFACPELRVEGVTTVAGNASIEAVTSNARGLLAVAGADLPLGRGAAAALALENVDATQFHGADGRSGISGLPDLPARDLPPATEVLRASLCEREVECVVALGPLTNLAVFADAHPELLRGVEVVWMGGTLGAGNITPVAEYNCYADPVAVARVLHSGARLRVVGLDVTEAVVLREHDLRARPFGHGARGRLLDEALRALAAAEQRASHQPHAVLHDPCAIAAALDAELFRWEAKLLDVGADEGASRGRLFELPGDAQASSVAVEWAVEVHQRRILDLFRSRLGAWCDADADSASDRRAGPDGSAPASRRR